MLGVCVPSSNSNINIIDCCALAAYDNDVDADAFLLHQLASVSSGAPVVLRSLDTLLPASPPTIRQIHLAEWFLGRLAELLPHVNIEAYASTLALLDPRVPAMFDKCETRSDATVTSGGKDMTLSNEFTFDNVAGLAEQKQLLRAALLSDASLWEAWGGPPAGVLLLGPSGSGKTLLAAAAAGESHLPVYQVNGPDVLSAVVGEAEKRLASIFAQARATAPALVLLDRLEAVAPRQTSDGGLSKPQARLAAALAAELDQCARNGVRVVAVLQRIDEADPAVVRRLPVRITLPAPNRAHTLLLLRHGLARLRSNVSDAELDTLADALQTETPAGVSAAVQEAAMECLRQLIENGDDGTVRLVHFHLPE